MELEINAKAPNFEATIQTEEKITLSQYEGKWVVLFFYPKDNTSGCTTEACSFRDDFDKFKDINTVVLGISPDSVKSHNNFIQKHGLNYDLISDTEKEILQAYGVWKEKKMYGRTYMGVERSTFIIAPDGTIAEIYRKVKPAGHSDEVFKRIVELQNQ